MGKLKQRPKSTNKRLVWIISTCILVALILTAVFATLIVVNLEKRLGVTNKEQDMMVNYLENKYDQEFSITNLDTGTTGLGSTRTLSATAHSTTHSEINFRIWREDNSPTYYEDYLSALWSTQARSNIDHFIKEQALNVDEYEVGVSPSPELQDTISGFTPSWEEIRKTNPNQYAVSLVVYSTLPNSSRPQLEEAYQFLSILKDQSAYKNKFTYNYRTTSYIENTTGEQPLYEFSVSSESPTLENIQSSSDLSNNLKAFKAR